MSDATNSLESDNRILKGGADIEVLVTAQEAFPRLESLFLSAQTSIVMGFRLFDPRTKLLSEAARGVGDTWADLFLHTLNRGVPIDLTLSDFDPVMAPDMHEQAWTFMAILTDLNEISAPNAAQMTVRCVLHPAKAGIVSRLMFAAKTRRELRSIARDFNEGSEAEERLKYLPGLGDLLSFKDGQVCVRSGALPQQYPVTLHHKMAIFDGKTTYIGGLDLNERRIDDAEHNQPAQDTWHDLQLVVHSPDVATDATVHLQNLPDVIAGKKPIKRVSSPFLTTLSRKRSRNAWHLAPKTISDTIFKEHIAQIKRAKRFIYLESQYFRDRRIVSALVEAGKHNPDLRLLLLLPAAPEVAAFSDAPGLAGRFGEHLQARAFRRLHRTFGTRFLAVSPVQPREPDARDTSSKRATLENAPIVYVHSKVSIFDDRAAIVSSANLNGRSMKWDAEAGLLLSAPEQVQMLTKKIFDHWLGGETDHAPDAAFDVWLDRALRNADLPAEQRRGFIVPYDRKPAAQASIPVPGMPEEMV
ncbi:phospholipase D family protein [Pacificibacter marinus]|uniref:phospholipase D family protein n=1 Tax=Pacificibacter marinus TaxID=658057 RepID=UPI00147EC23C|nr:phospholipase D-like domain-containing protein [Pacificibacter marinus]